MSIISKIKPYILPVAILGASLGYVKYEIGSAANEVNRQDEIRQTINRLEKRGAKFCGEIYGRLASKSPDLLEACKTGYQTDINKLKSAL